MGDRKVYPLCTWWYPSVGCPSGYESDNCGEGKACFNFHPQAASTSGEPKCGGYDCHPLREGDLADTAIQRASMMKHYGCAPVMVVLIGAVLLLLLLG